jgi:hypothetical protein
MILILWIRLHNLDVRIGFYGVRGLIVDTRLVSQCYIQANFHFVKHYRLDGVI